MFQTMFQTMFKQYTEQKPAFIYRIAPKVTSSNPNPSNTSYKIDQDLCPKIQDGRVPLYPVIWVRWRVQPIVQL